MIPAKDMPAQGQRIRARQSKEKGISCKNKEVYSRNRVHHDEKRTDGGIFPIMEDFLCHLKSKAYQKRTVGIMENGSWAPMAAKQMKAYLEQMKDITVLENTVTVKSTVKADTIEAMAALAEELCR